MGLTVKLTVKEVACVPEAGWRAVTVRLDLYERLKAMAEARGLTMDEVLRQLMSEAEAGRSEAWTTCQLCGARLKASRLERHLERLHPRRQPPASWQPPSS